MCPSKDYKNKRPRRIFTFPKRDLPTIGNCLVKIRNWSLPPEKWYIIQHGPRIFAASQGALNTEQLSSPKRWFSHSMLCWCSLSLNIVRCSGLHDIKRTLRFLKVSRGRPKCGRGGGMSCEERLRPPMAWSAQAVGFHHLHRSEPPYSVTSWKTHIPSKQDWYLCLIRFSQAWCRPHVLLAGQKGDTRAVPSCAVSWSCSCKHWH